MQAPSSHMNEHETPLRNLKSRSEIGQKFDAVPARDPSSKSLSKANENYWRPRLKKRTYRHKGELAEVSDWQVRIAYRGSQRWINLGTPNRDAAAKLARDKWLKLMAGGWPAVLTERQERVASPTVGEYLDAVRAHGGLSGTAFGIYAKKFRQLVAAVFGFRATPRRFSYHTGEHEKWRQRVCAVRLQRLTATAIKRWLTQRLRQDADNPAQLRATAHPPLPLRINLLQLRLRNPREGDPHRSVVGHSKRAAVEQGAIADGHGKTIGLPQAPMFSVTHAPGIL